MPHQPSLFDIPEDGDTDLDRRIAECEMLLAAATAAHAPFAKRIWETHRHLLTTIGGPYAIRREAHAAHDAARHAGHPTAYLVRELVRWYRLLLTERG
jgi:hypothetical protein